MLYHETKDILYVKQFLGHRNIECTMLYIQLDQGFFAEENDRFTCKVARTEKEVSQLIEAGFEYVCDLDDAKCFRKRK